MAILDTILNAITGGGAGGSNTSNSDSNANNTVTVNGIKITINPFTKGFVTGTIFGIDRVPNPAPVALTFDKPINFFSIDAVDPQVQGSRVVGYDSLGNEVASSDIAYKPKSQNYTTNITLQSDVPFVVVRIFGAPMDHISFKNISVEPASVPVSTFTPEQPNPVPLPAVPTILSPPSGSIRDVLLASIIKISQPEIDKSYIKNTLTPIPAEHITIGNTSTSVELDVSLLGIQGVSFIPNTFTLKPLGSQDVIVNFDVVQINQLPDGVSKLNCIVNVSSRSTIKNLDISAPIPSSAPTILSQDLIGTFIEERFTGAPNSESEAVIFSRTPFSKRTVENIDVVVSSPMTIRWTGKINMVDGNYVFRIRTDDGMRGFLNGKSIFNFWYDQSPTDHEVNVVGSAGENLLVVEYYNNNLSGMAQLSYDLGADLQMRPPQDLGTPVTSPELPNGFLLGGPVSTGSSIVGRKQFQVDN